MSGREGWVEVLDGYVRIAVLLAWACAPALAAGTVQPGGGQTTNHLAWGVNRGAVESSAGGQTWDFWADPGTFQVVFAAGNPQGVFPAGRTPLAVLAFAPSTPGATVVQRAIAGGGLVFSGSVTQRTRVSVRVEPARGAQGGGATEYTLVATGSVEFDGEATGAGSAPGASAAGVYAVATGWTEAGGVVTLAADGTLTTTNGLRGTWALVDAGSRRYAVRIGADRRTLVLEPGRGFVDAENKSLALERRH